MSERVWTPAQRGAIEADGCRLIVPAAAGSGKTAVLVARAMRLLRGGCGLERLLVVTFTEAAAGEMRERLSARMEEDEILRPQAVRMESAHIRTLHSFCHHIVRREFAVAGVDPGVRVTDERQADALRDAAADTTLDALLAEDAPDRAGLDVLFAKIDDYKALLKRVYAFVRSLPDPDAWLEACAQALTPDDDGMREALWARAVRSSMAEAAAYAHALYARAHHEATRGGCMKAQAVLENEMPSVAAVLNGTRTGIGEALEALSFTRGRWGKNWPKEGSDPGDAEASAEAKRLRADARDVLKALAADYTLSWPDACAAVRETAASARWLARLVTDFSRRYDELKEQRACIDFNDLEHLALKVLRDDDARRRVAGGFAALLVDECQDNSRVQQAIIDLLAPEDGLFQVGDVKQSIYRFRNADPGLFLSRQKAYDAADGARNRRIDLDCNFRSHPGVLRAVNTLFERLMTGETGEIDYADGHALVPGRAGDEQPDAVCTELHLLVPQATAAREDEEEPADLPTEAELVADLIAKTLGTTIRDRETGQPRPAEPKDIVVLLRSIAPPKQGGEALAALCARELWARGIPCIAPPEKVRLSAAPSRRAMAVLRAAVDAREDMAVIGAMRALGFGDADLAAIRARSSEGDFGEALRLCLHAGPDDAPAMRVCAFWQRLEAWRLAARTLPADEAVRRILGDAAGDSREMNFWARQLKDESPRTSLGEALDRLTREGGDAPEEPPADDNAVRIMSMHASKGCEYPVVVVAGLGKQFNQADEHPPVLLHRDLGMGFLRVLMGGDGAYRKQNTLCRKGIARAMRSEAACEEMRLLYVAMTRARERLLLTARVTPKLLAGYDEEPSPWTIAHAARMIDWLAPVAMAHPEAYDVFTHTEIEQAGDVQPADDAPLPADERPEPRRLRYAFEAATRLLRKTTVTRLAREGAAALGAFQADADAAREEPTASPPRFLRGEAQVTPAQRGEATHALMRLCRPALMLGRDASACAEAARQALEAALLQGLIAPSAARVIPLEGVAVFWASPLGQRAAASPRLLRESPFVRQVSASSLDDALPDEGVLVQGVIDLAFAEDDGWVLVDFKTDAAFTPEQQEASRRRHASQLRMYAEALAAIGNCVVKQAVVWLVMPGIGLDIDMA